MKIIGTLDSRDDGDLLPYVLKQATGMFDAIYAYDDGSVDNTFKVLSEHPAISKVFKKDQFSPEERGEFLQHRRGFLLDQIKKDFPFEKEEIWIVRLEGDRFFLNQSPKEIVERAKKRGDDHSCMVQLEFNRHRLEGWDQDDFPNWKSDIREIQRWFKFEEVQPCVAFRVMDYVDYRHLNNPRPWPGGLKKGNWGRGKDQTMKVSKEMCILEHHGRRSPKYMHWAFQTKSRGLSRKFDPLIDCSSPEKVLETWPSRYAQYKLYPFVNLSSLDKCIEIRNEWPEASKQMLRYYFWGAESLYKEMGCTLPPREYPLC